jgi:hypothetical protein
MFEPAKAVEHRLDEIIARSREAVHRRPRIARVLAWGALLGFYYATAPGNRTEADDAFWYACLVRDGSLPAQLADSSSHLLYLPFMTTIYRLALHAGVTLSSYDLLRFMSSIAAASTAVLFFFLLRRRLNVSIRAAVASTVGLCVSYGFWRYANEAEVYALAAALIVLGLWLALGPDTRLSLASVVLVFTLATFISILSLIPAVVVVPLLLGSRSGYRNALVYLASLSLLLGAISYGAYQRADHGAESLVDFLEGPPPQNDWPTAAARSVVGLGQSLVAGNFLLTNDAVLDAFQERFPDKVLEEERFLAAHTSPLLGMAPFVSLSILFIAAALLGFQVLRTRRPSSRRSRPPALLVALLVGWVVAYWFAVLRADAAAPEAWTLVWIPLWILVAIVVFDRVEERPRFIGLFIGALFLHNLLGGILLMHNASTDFSDRKASWLVAHARSDDVILTAVGSVFPRYLAYQSAGRVISLSRVDTLADMEKYYHLALTTPGDVYMTGDVLQPPSYILDQNPAQYAALRELSTRVGHNAVLVSNDPFGGVHLVTNRVSIRSGAAQDLIPRCPTP